MEKKSGAVPSQIHKIHSIENGQKQAPCRCEGQEHNSPDIYHGHCGHGHEETNSHCHHESLKNSKNAQICDDHAHGHDHSHDHGHGCSHDGCGCGQETVDRKEILMLSLCGLVFFLFLLLPLSEPVRTAGFLLVFLAVGGKTLLTAMKNICRGELFDETFLMTIAGIGAFLSGQAPEGAAVMLFYQVGEALSSAAAGRSRRSIAALMDLRPETARAQEGEGWKLIPAAEAAVGMVLLVYPGEKVPLDGTVLEGESYIDTSSLTGESVPRSAGPGDRVMGGCVNQDGMLKIRADKPLGASAVSKILELTQEASARKAKAERFITRFSRIYTPVVVGLAAVLAILPPLILGGGWETYLHRALVFLVISCPCALVISVPLGFFAGIGSASRQGILIKGGNFLEALCHARIVVFDKTGTLTGGSFKVTDLRPVRGTRQELLAAAARVEIFSTHPIARSILQAAQEMLPPETRRETSDNSVKDYTQIPGKGVRASADGHIICAGNRAMMAELGLSPLEEKADETLLHVAVDGEYTGTIALTDAPKPDAQLTISGLRAFNVRKTVLLTGDRAGAGASLARELGIGEVYTDLLPADKAAHVERLKKELAPGETLLYVGDGVNDAPVLALADVGIAMGALGSDAAIEAADVVLTNDQPSRLITALSVARRTRRIVLENIIFSLGVKAVFLILGGFGAANLWEAVFADVGVCLLTILNAIRCLRQEKSM